MAVAENKDITKQKPIKVGERVRFGSPWNRQVGEVIEDRGLLGVGGKQIVRIRYGADISDSEQLDVAETETAAEEVKPVRILLYEFDAQADDQLILQVDDFAGEGSVVALVVPESQRHRFDPWQPGKPIGFFGPDEALMATPQQPIAHFRVPTTGFWLVQVVINEGGALKLVRQDNKGDVYPANIVKG